MNRASSAGATLTQLLLDAAVHGEQPCFSLISSEDSRIVATLTFAGAIENAKRTAGTLRQAGFQSGDRLVIAARPSTVWITTFLGTIFAGGVAVPVNHRYRRRELAPLLSACDPFAIVVDDATEAAATAALGVAGSPARLFHLTPDDLQSAEPVTPEPRESTDLAVILHTSGTTGEPKGVERTQGEYAEFVDRWRSHTMVPGDRVLNFLPLYHQAGLLCSFLSAFVSGLPMFHVDRFNRKTFWLTVDTHELTWAILMQPVPRYLLDDAAEAPDQSHALEWIVATARPDDWVSFQERFGVAVQSSYGSTETTILRVTGGRRDGPVDPARVHGPLGGALCGRSPESWADIRVVTQAGEVLGPEQPGFIEVRGETVLRRYFRSRSPTHDAFVPGDWFRSGDFGYFSASGDLYFLDRISGLIRRSGENIAPREVEELLEEHPGVAEAAVIGVADELRGEEVAAFVVPRPGISLTADELFTFCEEHLAHFKAPRYIELRAELPHTPTFKVQRAALGLSAAAVERLPASRPAAR
jgi:carnitine-CoA ligase